MKKLLAILLVLAMLVPMGVVVQAEEATETKPFFLIQWQGFQSELTNTYQMPFVWTNSGFLDNPLGCVALNGDYDISNIAARLKEIFDARPNGSRFFNFTLAATAFKKTAEDVVFVDRGVEICQTWFGAFLAEFKAIGGDLDGLMIDVEFEDLYSTYIHSRYAVNDPLVYDKIVKNPNYAKDIRPKLEERGFKFYSPVTAETPEIFGIHPSAGSEYTESRSIWDAVLRSYIGSKITEAIKEIWDYYPDAIVSDYQSKNIKPWIKEQGDFGGSMEAGGIYTKAGNSNNENFYSVRPYNFFEDPATQGPAYNTFPRHNRAQYVEKPFNYFKFESNLFKNTYMAAGGEDVCWYISDYMYNLKKEQSVSQTPYYAETILHMGMLNPSHFLGFIIQANDIIDEEDYEMSMKIADDIMRELTRVLGAADRKPIDVMPYWNESYVLSGMYAGGKNYYRITPDTSVVSLENFKVADAADPTFYVDGVTVTFPGGKILETGSIREIGTCGYWVETAADVKPVVTKAANYWENYPSYMENYESYEVGSEYNFKTALPETCWEPKKSGAASATIVADPTDAANKMLALKGNYTFTNVNLPKNVTAGDSYAERQAWEISVILPSDLDAEAEIALLKADGIKKKAVDGGFVLMGNKVYYDQAGEYMELPGVTLNAGEKYTFKRDMDFTVAGAYQCSYYVYDASGNVIGKAENIPTAAMEEVPVTGIIFSCTGVKGEAVLFDNYKLYPTYVGYDFDLYDTKTGIKAKDMSDARTADTTYRFSWLNTTSTEKIFSIVASYYNGDNLVKEEVLKQYKLAPYSDCVEFGNVVPADGQTVRLSVRDDSPVEVDDGPGKTDKKGSNKNLILIIVAVAIALLVAVEAVVLVNSANKKKKKAAAKKAAAKKAAPKAEETPKVEETPETDAE